MNKLQSFIFESLEKIGAHGLVDTETECGCCLNDFVPCGDGPYPDCQPAIRLIVPDDGESINPLNAEVIPGEGQDWVMVPFDGSLGSGY